LGWNAVVVKGNFHDAWTPVGVLPPAAGVSPFSGFGILVGLCTAQIGSLFAADAWNNITFTAGEVRNPARNVPLSLALGAIIVIALYILANLAYMLVLPFAQIQSAPSDRVAAAMFEVIFPGIGATLIAVAIMVSAFGCMNGMILSGARAYFAMALDGLFFKRAANLNAAGVPSSALGMQALWVAVLVMIRTYNPQTRAYGNLYSNLLDYVISAALIFYILTIAGLFRLRRTRPDMSRPYRAWGYPVVPAFYVAAATGILVTLFLYRPATTVPGLLIVLLGVPVYFLFRSRVRPAG
jgi:APA family basic amino acid/polyamine antiporter